MAAQEIEHFIRHNLATRMGGERRRVLVMGSEIGGMAVRLATAAHIVTAIGENKQQMSTLNANLGPLKGEAFDLPLEPDELEPILRRNKYGLIIARGLLGALSSQKANRTVELMRYATEPKGYNVIFDTLSETNGQGGVRRASPTQIRSHYEESSGWALTALEDLAEAEILEQGTRISFDVRYVAVREPQLPYSPDWSA